VQLSIEDPRCRTVQGAKCARFSYIAKPASSNNLSKYLFYNNSLKPNLLTENRMKPLRHRRLAERPNAKTISHLPRSFWSLNGSAAPLPTEVIGC
jgi:hypothetical protein